MLRSLITFLILAAISGCFGPPEKVPAFPKKISWLNRPADYPLPNFKNKITIFGFYTEDCAGCIKIQPSLKNIMKKYGNKVQVIGVYTPLPQQQSTKSEIKKFLRTHHVSYPILLDKGSTLLRAFHITGWPTLVISDKDTKVIGHIDGPQPEAMIMQPINRALKSPIQ